jgi:hypothetical protein
MTCQRAWLAGGAGDDFAPGNGVCMICQLVGGRGEATVAKLVLPGRPGHRHYRRRPMGPMGGAPGHLRDLHEGGQHLVEEMVACAASVVSSTVGLVQSGQASVQVTEDSNPIQAGNVVCQG